MAQSELLDILQAASNQANLYTTINDIVEALEYATQRFLEVDLSASNGEYPFDTEDFVRNVAFRFIDANETNEVFFPSTVNGNDTYRLIAVINASGAQIECISTDETLTATGETVTLADGESAILIIERDNIYAIGGAGGGGSELQTYSFFFPGTPAQFFYIYQNVMAVDPEVVFPANFAGSKGRVMTNPTAAYSLDVRRRNIGGTYSYIGSIDITTGGVVSFTTNFGTAKSLVPGEVLAVYAPNADDATLAGLSVTFVREA